MPSQPDSTSLLPQDGPAPDGSAPLARLSTAPAPTTAGALLPQAKQAQRSVIVPELYVPAPARPRSLATEDAALLLVVLGFVVWAVAFAYSMSV